MSDSERDSLLLRYFERKSAREMARTLGISDEAAQRRVSRAVERLREVFSKRGLVVGSSGFVTVISASYVAWAVSAHRARPKGGKSSETNDVTASHLGKPTRHF